MISFASVLCQLMNGTRSDEHMDVLVVHREQGGTREIDNIVILLERAISFERAISAV
jgi:hypothetical protein